MFKNEKHLLANVDRVIYSAIKNPEEAVEYFFQKLLSKIDYLADFYPRRKIGDTSFIKEKLIKNKIRSALRLIDVYNETVSDLELEWLNLAKKWEKRLLDTSLINLSKKFQKEASLKFQKMNKASLDHIDNLEYILESYSLTEEESNEIEKTIERLDKIKKMSYQQFISNLKDDKLEEV